MGKLDDDTRLKRLPVSPGEYRLVIDNAGNPSVWRGDEVWTGEKWEDFRVDWPHVAVVEITVTCDDVSECLARVAAMMAPLKAAGAIDDYDITSCHST